MKWAQDVGNWMGAAVKEDETNWYNKEVTGLKVSLEKSNDEWFVETAPGVKKLFDSRSKAREYAIDWMEEHPRGHEVEEKKLKEVA